VPQPAGHDAGVRTGRFRSFDGVEIAYDELGPVDGAPVVLLHGFAADASVNWHRPGVSQRLADAGWLVVVPDARGHGRSDAPHDVAAYGGGAMRRDVAGLLHELGYEAAALVGYSMGAFVAGGLAAAGGPAQGLVRALVLAAVGDDLARGGTTEAAETIAAGLEAPDPRTVRSPTARAFRNFADATGADRLALAAVQRAGVTEAVAVARVEVPTLVIAGERDHMLGSAEALAALLPCGEARRVPGNHLDAVVSPDFATAVAEFLARTASGAP
jgi:pimeloyl-ACP methyl ester carboxylesterase